MFGRWHWCALVMPAMVVVLAACGGAAASSSSGSAPHFSIGSAVSRTPSAAGHAGAAAPATPGLVPSTVSADDIQAFLDAHNARRAKYNETPLTWSAALASLAQDWSNQMAQTGNFDHRPNNNEGENIFSGTGTYSPKDVVDAWGNEVSNFHADSNTCDPNAECGHFTQIVWATTTTVGCGSATAADGTVYWTCNYDPPGNFTGIGPFDAAAQQQALGGM